MCSAKPGPICTLTDQPFVHKCSYTDIYAQWTDCLCVCTPFALGASFVTAPIHAPGYASVGGTTSAAM